MAAYAAVFTSGDVPSVIALLVTVASSVAVLVVSGRQPVRAQLMWRLMAGGTLLMALGQVARAVHGELIGLEDPFPSIADLPFVVGYAANAFGVLMLIRRRSHDGDIDSWLDAGILTSAIAVVLWTLLVGPYFRDAAHPMPERMLNLGYFLLTLTLLTLITRLMVTAGSRVRSYSLLFWAIGCFVVTDVLATLAYATGRDPSVIALGTIPTASLFCAAIFHPSAREIADPPQDIEAGSSLLRLILLGSALSVPVLVEVFELLSGSDNGVNRTFAVGSSLVMMGLVLFRMHRLVQARERIAARERALRIASERLVDAGTVDALNGRAAEALTAVIDSARLEAVGTAIEVERGVFEVVTITGDEPMVAIGDRVAFLEEDQHEVGDLLRGSEMRRARGDLYGALFSVPDEPDRVLFAFTDGPIDRHDRRAFESLGREVGLARRGLLAAQMVERNRTERRFESLVQHSTDIVMVATEDLTATYVSPAVETQLGWSPNELVGTSISGLVPESERDTVLESLRKMLENNPSGARMEIVVHDAQGRRRLIDLTVTDLTKHPEVQGFVLNGRDITEANQLRADLMHAAYHDALTGLPNRTQFTSDLSSQLKEARDHHVAVLFLDLDDFKTINDGLGHPAGDQVLRAVAARLSSAIGLRDVAARLGGDEFALLIADGDDYDAIEQLAERVLDMVREPVDIEGRQVTTSASMGIVVANAATSADAVQRNADVAMYHAKAAGKGRSERFEDHMQSHALERLELKADLRRAIDRGELELDYQPIVDLASMQTSSVEALVRWRHPQRGRIPPDQFIGLAEETGLIHPLGMWVLDEACRQLAAWRTDPATESLKVAVNLSANQLPEARLPEEIAQTIARHDVPPECITIEITENVLMDESDFTARRLRELRDIGVSLAIDDFGTGYSSLGYLQRYPFDVLKIDRTFVSGLDQPGPNAEVAAAIIDLANRLDVRTVAEGIETEPELDTLIDLGCTCGQGYFLSRPTTPDDILARMRGERGLTAADGPDLATLAAAALDTP